MGISDRVSGSRSHKTMDDNSQSRDGTNGNGTSEEVEGRYLLKEVLKQIVSENSLFSELRLRYLPLTSFVIAQVCRLSSRERHNAP